MHETASHSKIQNKASNRSFGLTVGGIILAIVAWRYWADKAGFFTQIFAVLGFVLCVLALIKPSLLAALNRWWFLLGLGLAKVVNPIVLGFLFFLVMTPIGLLKNLFSKNPLGLKWEKEAKSYWIEREPVGPKPESMTDQF